MYIYICRTYQFQAGPALVLINYKSTTVSGVDKFFTILAPNLHSSTLQDITHNIEQGIFVVKSWSIFFPTNRKRHCMFHFDVGLLKSLFVCHTSFTTVILV